MPFLSPFLFTWRIVDNILLKIKFFLLKYSFFILCYNLTVEKFLCYNRDNKIVRRAETIAGRCTQGEENWGKTVIFVSWKKKRKGKG